MAFSIFNKKDDAPPKRPAPARAQPAAPKKPDAPAAPSARAQAAGQLSQRIDLIQAEMEEFQAEMEEFTLDFSTPPSYPSPPAARSQPSDAQVAAKAAPARQLPSDVFDAVLRDLAPAVVPVPGAVPPALPAVVSPPMVLPPVVLPPVVLPIASPVPPVAAVAATPVAPAFAPAAGAAKKPLIEHGFNPAAMSAAKRAAKAPAPPAATPSVSPAATKSAPANAAPPLPLPVQGVASVMMMEIEQSPFEDAPVLERVASLYASGEELAALAALTEALQNASMPAAPARHAYFLLFDLLGNLGRRDEFDAAALDFAVRFETSPPAFNDRSDVKDPALATGGGQYFALTGVLDSTAAQQFVELAKAAEKNQVLRIEFGNIGAVAQSGATQLLQHLQAFKKSRHDLVFSGTEHLIKLLTSSIETGRRSDPQEFWMLLLEMYQFQQMQAAFEETALDYCITYEVSPPSWVEPVKALPATPPAGGAATLDMPEDAFYLKGELAGPADAVLKALAVHAGGKPRVVIDLFNVKRMDRAAAAAFLNMTETLHSVKKEIEIRAASPLLAALLVSMGVLRHARFTRRGGKQADGADGAGADGTDGAAPQRRWNGTAAPLEQHHSAVKQHHGVCRATPQPAPGGSSLYHQLGS